MNEENKTKVDAIIRKWNGKRGSLIMALHELQGQFGYVPWDEALYLGQNLGIPMAKIYECLTFYNYFKLKAPGKYIISICDGTACHIKEGAGVLAELEKELGVPAGTTTDDGLFFIQVVRCLGCCGLAPVMVINGTTYGKMTPDKVKGIINEWRAKEGK